MKTPKFRVAFYYGAHAMMTRPKSINEAWETAAALARYLPMIIVDTATLRRQWNEQATHALNVPTATDPYYVVFTPMKTPPLPQFDLAKTSAADAAKFLGWEHYLSGLMTRRSARERQRTATC